MIFTYIIFTLLLPFLKMWSSVPTKSQGVTRVVVFENRNRAVLPCPMMLLSTEEASTESSLGWNRSGTKKRDDE